MQRMRHNRWSATITRVACLIILYNISSHIHLKVYILYSLTIRVSQKQPYLISNPESTAASPRPLSRIKMNKNCKNQTILHSPPHWRTTVDKLNARSLNDVGEYYCIVHCNKKVKTLIKTKGPGLISQAKCYSFIKAMMF